MELTLEKLAPPPQNGVPAGQPYKEDKKNRVVPGNYSVLGKSFLTLLHYKSQIHKLEITY